MTRIKSLLFGFSLPYEAAQLILRDRVLLFWSILPLALSAGLSFTLIHWLQNTVQGALIRSILTWGWDPHAFWAAALLLVSRLILWLIGALIFSLTAGTVAAPFNDFLAEQTESRATPPLPRTPQANWKVRIRLIRTDFIKTLAATLASAVTLIFSWVPIINFSLFIVTAMLITFQLISYPQTRRGQGIPAALSFLYRYFWASLGLGLAIALLYSIPLVSILTLPVSVVGGTLLFARAQETSASGKSLR